MMVVLLLRAATGGLLGRIYPPRWHQPSRWRWVRSLAWGILPPALLGGLNALWHAPGHPELGMAALLLFAALLGGYWGGLAAGLTAWLLAVLVYGYFYMPPYFDFRVFPDHPVGTVFLVCLGLGCCLMQEDLRRQYVRAQHALDTADGARQAHDQAIARIVHDVRNPLAALRLRLDLMQDRFPHQSQEPEQIIELTEQLDIVQELLEDWSNQLQDRPERPLRLREVNLADIVWQAIHQQRADRQESVIFLPPPGGVVGRWDPYRLRRLVANLVANAIKYSPHGGRITVQLQADSDAVWLRVADEGLGIPAAEQGQVLHGQRASNVRGIPGQGLGLAYVSRVLEQHGGVLSLESRLGQGTTVTCEFPRWTPATACDARPLVSERRGADYLGPGHLLHLESNEDGRALAST